MRNKWWAKLLRIVGIVLMSLTAAFTLMAGIGTSCVALDPTGYGESFAGIAPFQWLYILFVLITVAIGVIGVRAAILLSRGGRDAYRSALIALIAGTVVGGAHIAASRLLRGSSMPVDAVVYVTVLTLLVFILIRIPGIWQYVNYEKPDSGKKTDRQATAIALSACGLLALTIQFLMAPTHTINGINYSDVWHITFTILGIGLILGGIAAAVYDRITLLQHERITQTH